jgi:hypothetical protein
MKSGKTRLHGWFQDKDSKDLCDAYFAYVRGLGSTRLPPVGFTLSVFNVAFRQNAVAESSAFPP